MDERRLTVLVDDGEAEGWLSLPEGDGPWPTIVFYADAGGPRPAMSQMIGRLVSRGYAVLQPHFYWRSAPYAPVDGRTVFSVPSERARLGTLMASVQPERVMEETRLLLERAARDASLRVDRIGAVGYCMGGRLAFLFATHLPQVAAIAAIHAGGLVGDTPESPHLRCRAIRGEVYLGVAEDDASCTPEDQATLREALDTAGVRYTMDQYGARHGWAVPDFPVYDAGEAERHWRAILALFARALAPTGSHGG